MPFCRLLAIFHGIGSHSRRRSQYERHQHRPHDGHQQASRRPSPFLPPPLAFRPPIPGGGAVTDREGYTAVRRWPRLSVAASLFRGHSEVDGRRRHRALTARAPCEIAVRRVPCAPAPLARARAVPPCLCLPWVRPLAAIGLGCPCPLPPAPPPLRALRALPGGGCVYPSLSGSLRFGGWALGFKGLRVPPPVAPLAVGHLCLPWVFASLILCFVLASLASGLVGHRAAKPLAAKTILNQTPH